MVPFSIILVGEFCVTIYNYIIIKNFERVTDFFYKNLTIAVTTSVFELPIIETS